MSDAALPLKERSLLPRRFRVFWPQTGLWQWEGPKQSERSCLKAEEIQPPKEAFYFTALWGRITSNCSSQDVQEIDGFKDREVPPVWWVNFNHQSGTGGACHVQKAICILICLIQQCVDIFHPCKLQLTSSSGPQCIPQALMRAYDAFKCGWCF